MRPPSVTQESIRNHPDHDHPSTHFLLKLPFVTGMSHRTKATSGSLAVSGCGYRYSGTPHDISQYRTTFFLYTGADLCRGILTLADTTLLFAFFQRFLQVSCYFAFFLVLQGTPFPLILINENESLPGYDMKIISHCSD